MKSLRRHKDWLMIVIAILAIPFIFYFVRTPDYGAMGEATVGSAFMAASVSMLKLQQIVRLLAAWRRLWACLNFVKH